MIKIYNKSLQPVAILENAFDISYDKGFNEVWQSAFSLPLADEKNELCKPLNYMELTDEETGEYIGLFRLIPSLIQKDESREIATYHCEHVLATLLDGVLFQYHQVDGLPTKDSIQYILDKQHTKHWQVGNVASSLNRFFSFKWENENLLSALFSIPRPLDKPYQWTWETQSYPWTLNLAEPETVPSCEIRVGKNQRGIEKEEDPTVAYNRIYALGQGEGSNQLDITKVNNGVPYVEDAESINKYGLRQTIFADRRFESAESLKATVQALLEKWKNPKITYRVSAADVSSITGEDIDKLRLGKVVRMVDDEFGTLEARILRERKSDMKGNPGALELEIASKTEDLGATQADLQRRQAINELYSQGNTCMDSHDFEDNADSTHPAIMTFYLPDEAVKVNRLDLTFECTNFRSYGKATKAAGQTVISTTAEAGGSQTITTTSANGGGETVTSEAGGDHYHRLFVGGVAAGVNFIKRRYFAYLKDKGVATSVNFEADADGDIYTYEASGGHSHRVQTTPHKHQVQVNIDPHTHAVKVSVPSHSHDVEHGIFLLEQLPTAVTVKVDGITVPHTAITGENIDLVPYLAKESDGNVKRGFHRIEIKPNNLARISAQVTSQFFLQSRGQYSL